MKTAAVILLLLFTALASRLWIDRVPIEDDGMRSVVLVQNDKGNGTGFFLEGHLITALHVLNGEESANVMSKSGVVQSSECVKKDEELDLVELKVKEGRFGFRLAKTLSPMDRVYQLGHPGPMRFVRVAGTFMAFDGKANVFDITTFFGNSGSPLTNENGEVVGMAHSIVMGGHMTLAGTIQALKDFISRPP